MKKIIGLINRCAGTVVTFVSLASILGVGELCSGISKLGFSAYIGAYPKEVVIGCLSIGILCMAGIMAWFFKTIIKRIIDNTVDYKVVCRKLPDALADELATKDKASPYVNEAQARFCNTLDEQGFKDLLNSADVDCVNIKAESKKGKTILQCSFIPVDADGNTIIVRRCATNHISIFKKILSWFKTVNAFISFSPIPDGHNRLFDSIAKCYAHEVPNDGVKLADSDFEYVGVIYNRRGGGKRPWSIFPWRKEKLLAKLDQCIRYVFVVYIVHYRRSHFAANGKPNWKDIDLAFASKINRGLRKNDRFFLKDHDHIVGVNSVVEIGSALSTNGSDEGRFWLKVEQEALRRATELIAARVR